MLTRPDSTTRFTDGKPALETLQPAIRPYCLEPVPLSPQRCCRTRAVSILPRRNQGGEFASGKAGFGALQPICGRQRRVGLVGIKREIQTETLPFFRHSLFYLSVLTSNALLAAVANGRHLSLTTRACAGGMCSVSRSVGQRVNAAMRPLAAARRHPGRSRHASEAEALGEPAPGSALDPAVNSRRSLPGPRRKTLGPPFTAGPASALSCAAENGSYLPLN